MTEIYPIYRLGFKLTISQTLTNKMDVVSIGYFLFGFLLPGCLGSHRSMYHYYSYYTDYDGSASMIAGSVIGGLIALCVIIAVVVVIVQACNCCKTHGVRGHVVRPRQLPTISSDIYYNSQHNWTVQSAPPYQHQQIKPPQYSNIDMNPPPSYDDISGQVPPTVTSLPGPSSPVPPYSETNSVLKTDS